MVAALRRGGAQIKEVDGIARSLVLSAKRLDIARKRLGSVTAGNIGEVCWSPPWRQPWGKWMVS